MTDSTDKESTKSGNHHYNFFQSSFASVEELKALFRLAFSTEELRHFDLATIAFEKRDWLDSNRLTHRFADLVVSVRLKDGPKVSVTLVVEHKSWPDSNLMEQLLYYQSLIYVNETDSVVLPPLVVYHGKQLSWPKWRSFQQYKLGHLPESFVNEFGAEMIDFGIRLVNLRDATVRRRVAKLPLEIQLCLQAMADIWVLDAKTFDTLVDLVERANPLPDMTRFYFIRKIAMYFRKVHTEINFVKMMDIVYKHTGDNVVQRVAEDWSWLTEDEIRHSCRIEGRDEGREEMREEMSRKIAERLIRDGMDDQTVSGYTDLSPDEVRKIRNGH